MLYQLVLITNLGVVTPLASFPDYNSCMIQQTLTGKSAQYSAACLPTESPEQLQKRMQESMGMMLNFIKQAQKEIN